MEDRKIAAFVKEMRKKFNLTQVDLADKSGVGLRFVRELEQGTREMTAGRAVNDCRMHLG